MSFAMALWVRDTSLKLRQQGIELTRSSLNGITRNSPVYTNKTVQLKASGWTMPSRDGDMDTTWLL